MRLLSPNSVRVFDRETFVVCGHVEIDRLVEDIFEEDRSAGVGFDHVRTLGFRGQAGCEQGNLEVSGSGRGHLEHTFFALVPVNQ